MPEPAPLVPVGPRTIEHPIGKRTLYEQLERMSNAETN